MTFSSFRDGMGVSWLKFPEIRFINLLLKSGSLDKKEIFVDIGSGEGDKLILAYTYGMFSKVIGIEICPVLAKKSRKILSKLDIPFEIINCDFNKYDKYEEADVIYTYGPDGSAAEIVNKKIISINKDLIFIQAAEGFCNRYLHEDNRYFCIHKQEEQWKKTHIN